MSTVTKGPWLKWVENQEEVKQRREILSWVNKKHPKNLSVFISEERAGGVYPAALILHLTRQIHDGRIYNVVPSVPVFYLFKMNNWRSHLAYRLRQAKEDIEMGIREMYKEESGTRVVNINNDPYDVYIGRGSIWGNPFVIGPDGGRGAVLSKYREYIKGSPILMRRLHEDLEGKVLGCHCHPAPCHGDILIELLATTKRPTSVDVP